ncbi:MAG: antitoxin [Angustibacter sp.]
MTATARLFMHGRSQAVRLPKEFRMPGNRVRVRRNGSQVVLEPLIDDVDDWFAAMDAAGGAQFPDVGAEQPPMPPDRDLFG